MKQQVRELLVTAKVAQSWQGQFDEKVDELMGVVNQVDTEKHIQKAGELLDVYRKIKQKGTRTRKKKAADCCERPFEFLVFRN
jgi:hypothetical protein